ncbi:MAG: diguanylate cyclase [Rhodospirillaceae bacterium]|nr:diguanylate cyclase [Rhodospirillaceae bacterium]
MAKILIVDDNTAIRDVIKIHLMMAGHEVIEAENGRQGVEMATEHQPDLVILDVMIPEMDGMEACSQIRTDPACAAVYVIMLSARGETSDKVDGLNTGADAYLTKPFEPDELIAQVNAGLRTAEDRRQAMYDLLTGLFNRRAFDDLMHRELSLRDRHGHGLSMVMIDLDHFKAVNDTYGHHAGDAVLRDLADILREVCRPSDLPCRWGGEEFACLLPQTDLENALKVGERLRAAIEAHDFPEVGKVTASLGISQAGPEENEESFCKRADEALYRAKEGGRNRIEAATSA